MAAEKHILVGINGKLDAINLDSGELLWTYNSDVAQGGKTPAVDQTNGFIYFQTYSRLHKINALNGSLVAKIPITGALTASGNTLLINDGHGYHVITMYYNWQAYGVYINCYDIDLNLEWSITGLNSSLKCSLCYSEGVLYIGTGEVYGQGQQEWYIGELENCRVIAYNIVDGSIKWEKVLSDPVDKIFTSMGAGVLNPIYCNGYIIAEIINYASDVSKLVVLNASDGEVIKTYTHPTWFSSCGVPAFSYGRFITGDLSVNKVLVFQIGTGAKNNFAPFGTDQTNQMAAPAAALASLDESITYLGAVDNGDQGACVKDEVVYVAYGTGSVGIVSFNIETMVVIRQFDTGNSYDASPLVVENRNEDLCVLIHENENERTICRKVSDGSLLWVVGNQPGNAIFGLTYYESSFITISDGMTSSGCISALNDNFTTLNTLIAGAATIITITTAVQWDDINANIASLNTNGVAVTVATIEEGMTGTQFNDIINNFVIDYNIANS